MITPMDIHNKTFSRGLRGYSQEEVDAFLQELASDYERIYREHREMEEEMDTVKTKLRNYEKWNLPCPPLWSWRRKLLKCEEKRTERGGIGSSGSAE